MVFKILCTVVTYQALQFDRPRYYIRNLLLDFTIDSAMTLRHIMMQWSTDFIRHAAIYNLALESIEKVNSSALH